LRARTSLVLLLAAIGATVAAPPAAEAANACRAHGKTGKIVAASSTALVREKGARFEHYVTACTFKGQKPFRLPGQDGEDTHHLHSFHLNGRYLAYTVFIQEEASPIAYSYVYSIDLTKRRKLIEAYAGDDAKSDETTTDVMALVVGKRGAVAWINESINLDVKLSVYSQAPGAKKALLDNGNDIGARSLALARNDSTFFWTRGGQPKSATLP
jgi:hypothetical protein